MPRRATSLSKLSRPRLSNAIHRERVYALLDAACGAGQAVMVVGPPGAGKTTAVATWLDARAREAVWYQLDAGDTDLASFFHYLRQEAGASRRRRVRDLPPLTPEYLPDVRGFSRRFFRRLFDCFAGEGVLVLDNYQEIGADDLLHEVVADALQEVPAGCCLVVISREDAPKAYARAMLNERVACIGWSDLRLTLDEAFAIGASRGLRGPDDLLRLHEEADGWAAGFTLLLEQRKTAGQAAVPRDASRQMLFDYFASQVFDGIAAHAQSFLLQSAVLPNIQMPVAEALAGGLPAGAVLEELYRRRLFVHRGPGNPPAYQYHALFREFLRKRLAEQTSGTELSDLLARAAAQLAAHGQSEEAVALYLEARLWGQAEALIVELAPAVLAQGRSRTLYAWLTALPAEHLSRGGWALYWFGMSQLQTAPRAARDYLTRANEVFGADGQLVGRLLAAAAIIRSHHFEYNTFEAMDRWIAQIEADLARGPLCLGAADELAIHSAVLLVVIYRLPGHPIRSISLARVSALIDADIDVNQRVSAGFSQLLAHAVAHENDLALRLIDRVQPLLGDASLSPLNRGYWRLLEGYLQHRRGERVLTQRALDEADRIFAEHGLRQPEFLVRCFRAQHCCSWSDEAGAVRALAGLEKSLSEARPMTGAQYHKQRFFLEMVRRDSAAAEVHAREAVSAAVRLGAPFFTVAWMSQGAAALAMNGSHADAEKWLDAAWQVSDNGFLKTYRPMVLASRAFLALCRNRSDEAAGALRDLFALVPDAEAFSYVGTVPVLRDAILVEALLHGISVPLVRALIRKYEVLPPRRDVPDWPWPVRVYALGPFRIEVHGQPLQYSRKTPRKVLLLLKALIAMGAQGVPQRRLVDALWPDEDGDAAVEAMQVSLYRLRKLLGHADAIQLVDGMLSIDRTKVWVDLWCFEQHIAGPSVATDIGTAAVRVLSLYRGHLFEEDADVSWAITARERTRDRLLRFLLAAGCTLEAAEDVDAAAQLYRAGIDIDELAEDLYQGLMRCLQSSGRTAQAVQVYRHLDQVLGNALGVTPSSGTRRLLEEICRRQ